MGIRFFCQECNKRLNVKGFLAGKRGVCPHCGAKVDIPWESQAETSGSPAAAPRSVAAAAGVNGTGFGTAVGTAAAVPAYPAIAPRVLPMSGPAPANPAAATPATIMPAPVAPAQPLQPAAQPMPAAIGPVAKAVPTAMPAPVTAAPVVAQLADPIAEAPNAVWYVRPPSGGQYGPASGEIMRKWLAEGRVSADSLVWREGWPDWKAAGAQFPQLGGGAVASPAITAAVPPQPVLPGPALAHPAGSPARSYPRKKNNSLAIVIVVLLTLMSIALFGVLIAVMQFMQ